ncbi:MAG: hypothetical protein AAGA87_16720 [Pseudomonadota bacterium]
MSSLPSPETFQLPDRPELPYDHRLAPLVAEAYQVMAAPHPFCHGLYRACSLSPRVEAGFFEVEQREVSAEFLREWYRGTHSDELTPEVMSWLLPRILELLALGQTDLFPYLEDAFQRLDLTDFPASWSPRAVDVFQRFARAQFRRMVLEDASELDALIAMFANSGLGAAPFLEVLWGLPVDALARVMFEAFCRDEAVGLVQTPLWTRQSDRTRTWAWYLSPDMAERMAEAATRGDETAGAVADLIERTLIGPGHTV